MTMLWQRKLGNTVQQGRGEEQVCWRARNLPHSAGCSPAEQLLKSGPHFAVLNMMSSVLVDVRALVFAELP